MSGSRGDLTPEERAAFKRRLENLDAKLDDKREASDNKTKPSESSGNTSVARYGIRMMSDFIAALIVGGVIGYGLQIFLGLGPWIFLVMLLFGFAAGVMGLMRTYKKMQAEIDQQTGGDIGQSIEPYDDEDDARA